MSDKKSTYSNTRTSKSSSQDTSLGGTGCIWWLVTTLVLIAICIFCGAKLTIGLLIGMSIGGFFLGAFLAGIFGDRNANFKVKPKHADVIEYFNEPSRKNSEVNVLLTEQQFSLIKTETENLCNFYSVIVKKTAVRELCDTVLALKNEDGTDWDISLKMKYAFISDIHKCFLGLGQDFDAENDGNLGLCLLLTKIADPDTEITYDNYAYYKTCLLDSYKGVLEISKQIINAGQFSHNKFIFQYILGKYDKDYQLKYMTHLYRFASASSKADGKVTEQETQWLSEIMKSTEDEGAGQPAENSKPKELDINTSPMEELQKLIGLSSVKVEIE
ncbi:MAG: hypothetical protein J6R91_05540, partial [Bacteroidaceae bacterium]|nr:hypothetical protein [Bacteroidaceae bacterium]